MRHLESFWSDTANPQSLLALPRGNRCWCWIWAGPLRTEGRFWGRTSSCLGSAVSNWFLILPDGLKRSLCSLPWRISTPRYKLSSGQQNSSSPCVYFPFSWFRTAVPCWDGRPWHLLLSWITQVSLQQFQSRAHPGAESIFRHTDPMDALPPWAWMDSCSMKSKEVLDTSILASSLHPLCRGKTI